MELPAGQSELFDYGGFAIKPGDFIAYAALLGRCACIRYGLVTRLVEPKKKAEWDYSKTKPIRVVAVQDEWQHNIDQGKPPWHLLNEGKELSLGFPDRLVVMRPDQIPDAVRNNLLCALRKQLEAAGQPA